jgi:integrase
MIPPTECRSLPLAEWPEEDRLAWQRVIAPNLSKPDDGDAFEYSPKTLKDLEARYGRFLRFAGNVGALKPDAKAAASVTEPVVRQYILWLEPRVGSVNLAGTICKLLRVATLFDPDRDWSWLRRFSRRLDSRKRPRDKRQDVVDIAGLVRLGFELMERAEKPTGYTSFERALLFRDGLIIAMLATTVLRIGAFVGLDIDKNLSFTGTYWTIHLPVRRNSKYRRPIEKPLPVTFTPLIDRWLREYRPRFGGANEHRRLWPSRNGILSESQASGMIVTRTKRAFGRPVGPHLFRHSAATMIYGDPGINVDLARAALDHTSQQTTDRHYNWSSMENAVRAFQTTLGLRR